jgi:hypothetical protein
MIRRIKCICVSTMLAWTLPSCGRDSPRSPSRECEDLERTVDSLLRPTDESVSFKYNLLAIPLGDGTPSPKHVMHTRVGREGLIYVVSDVPSSSEEAPTGDTTLWTVYISSPARRTLASFGQDRVVPPSDDSWREIDGSTFDPYQFMTPFRRACSDGEARTEGRDLVIGPPYAEELLIQTVRIRWELHTASLRKGLRSAHWYP